MEYIGYALLGLFTFIVLCVIMVYIQTWTDYVVDYLSKYKVFNIMYNVVMVSGVLFMLYTFGKVIITGEIE